MEVAKETKTDDYINLIKSLDNTINELNRMNFNIDISIITNKLNKVSISFNEIFQKLKTTQDERQSEILNYEIIIKNLHSGIKDYDPSIMRLKQLLIDKLSKKYNQSVSVDILCELIEIKNDRWKNAIEGYLHTQKFYLLVEPKYYIDALKIYELNKFDQKLYGIGLLDIGKIMKLEVNIKVNSLAEEVESSNAYAKAYISYFAKLL